MGKAGHSPQRTCLGCREQKEKESLLRIVCGPDGAVVVDLKGKLPGRGAYVCFDRSCIRSGIRGKILARAFGRSIDSSQLERMEERIRDAMEKRITAFLSILMKAGKVVVGRESIGRRLRSGELNLLVLAADGRVVRKETGVVPVRVFGSKERLGAAVGKSAQPMLGVADLKGSVQLLRWIDSVKALETAGRG